MYSKQCSWFFYFCSLIGTLLMVLATTIGSIRGSSLRFFITSLLCPEEVMIHDLFQISELYNINLVRHPISSTSKAVQQVIYEINKGYDYICCISCYNTFQWSCYHQLCSWKKTEIPHRMWTFAYDFFCSFFKIYFHVLWYNVMLGKWINWYYSFNVIYVSMAWIIERLTSFGSTERTFPL